MKTISMSLAALILAAGAAGFAAETAGVGDQTAPLGQTAQKDADKLQRIGGEQADQATNRDARTALARLINSAATPAHFSDVVASLAKPDRERIGNAANVKSDDLTKVIAKFRADFQAKYNQEFEITPEHLKGALVYGGRDKTAISVSLSQELPAPKGSAGTTDDPKNNADTPTGDALTLSLINEGAAMNAWRINIPDQISGDQLKDNLVKHLQMIDDQKSTWPEDVNAAYRAIAYHVLQAFNDSAVAVDR